ncbi:thioesterase family protein [Bradyrhizobium sp. WD16]|uniref:thioesterase family protein n=1 Tax=Bradyrhizobium sp. WD16 TaxID=1521768 RepID=UPI0020A55133|nr:thioesterase family protein [Bradyrhizobium sp. WD16]UTD27699.1 thioesterase [Bradyrhizobium sp. WD16]
MGVLDKVAVGMSGQERVTVTDELTVGHFVPTMPKVYATPMMILAMETASASAIAPHLPPGFVSVGTEVNIRHLAATPVGREVRATAKVIAVEGLSVVFEVAAFDGERKIGDGTHRRGIVEVARFEKRLAGG